VLVSAPVSIAKEYYLGIVIDRPRAQAMLIASPEGGVEIEEVAARNPEKILTKALPLDGRLKGFQLWEIAKFMGWKGEQIDQGIKLIAALAKAFVATDAVLLEINPLVLTKEGRLVALDTKLSIDENALFRQPGLAKLYDPMQVTPYEARAQEHELAYVALDGEIGCMVNGAGLAMATMDIIHHFGGSPANFLDVGGSASEEKIAEGFKIILSDPKVKAILINIFGGIMNCATLAGGIISAAKEQHISVPLVVRMEGTNVETGKQMLADSGLNIIIASNLKEAAQKSVSAAKRGK
jgi:succinyl-CoA synthetase beta subunit